MEPTAVFVTVSRHLRLAVLGLCLASGLPAQAAPAPISNIRYDLTFDSTTAAIRTVKMVMTFDAAGAAPVLLSLPAWTPGAYEISYFARNVRGFDARQDGTALTWDKADYDTWRVRPRHRGAVTVSFEYRADQLDNAMAWAKSNFLLVNGTNVFLYPEGASLNFPATVTVHTEPEWLVVTGMHSAGTPGSYRERNYHDLVDMPFFIGRFDLDSITVNGKVTRVATYPAGAFRGHTRLQFLDELGKSIPAEAKVFGETPWDDYTVMAIFDPSAGGGSALEHQSSHVGIYASNLIGTPVLASISAHEIFHAWNVKRLRPADLWPYRYDRPQETTWLWVSEGITDYYADLALVRGKVIDEDGFVQQLQDKITEVLESLPVALEDASLSTWIHPTDGTGYLYYPKGALAGLMLDILIRDASDNQHSLDDVMRGLYQRDWKQGRGFTGAEFWNAVQQAAGGKSFTEFNAKYVHGRETFPWDRVLPLAGMRLATDSIREPRIGVSTSSDTSGTLVLEVLPGSMAEAAGVMVGDFLVSVGEIDAKDEFGFQFRKRYAGTAEGTELPIVVDRGGKTLTMTGRLKMAVRVERNLELEPSPSPKALRIRKGITGA
jgi:predicted metalloprotease with PDZ domain